MGGSNGKSCPRPENFKTNVQGWYAGKARLVDVPDEASDSAQVSGTQWYGGVSFVRSAPGAVCAIMNLYFLSYSNNTRKWLHVNYPESTSKYSELLSHSRKRGLGFHFHVVRQTANLC